MRDLKKLREQAEPILRMACIIMAGIVVYELAEMAVRWNPFRHVTVPALPTLTADTNSPSGSAPAHPPIAGTPVKITAATVNATNAVTNLVAKVSTNVVPDTKGTNLIASATNTNAANATNALTVAKHPRRSPGMMPPGMEGMSFDPSGASGARPNNLPKAVQARIGQVVDSEILGPVMHPLPMALMGIAGDVAFLRSGSGQTGLVKEGDSLDDIKLLRIGINRVLIEQNGEKKELTIFSGYGGDSLLLKEDTNETIHP